MDGRRLTEVLFTAISGVFLGMSASAMPGIIVAFLVLGAVAVALAQQTIP